MKFYLQLKAWQMFILLFAPMFLPAIFINIDGPSIPFGIGWLVWMVILIGWMYTIGIKSNSLLPAELKKNTILYTLGFITPLIYGVLVATLFFPTIQDGAAQKPPIWFVPLHLASMFGMFYGLYFTAKQFTALKTGRAVKFLDYSGPFFLLWFFPLGVWFIQPSINEVLGDEV